MESKDWSQIVMEWAVSVTSNAKSSLGKFSFLGMIESEDSGYTGTWGQKKLKIACNFELMQKFTNKKTKYSKGKSSDK